MNRTTATAILIALQGCSLFDFVIFLLGDPSLSLSPTAVLFVNDWGSFLTYANTLGCLSQATTAFAVEVVTQQLQAEVKCVATKQAGWHFSACNARIEQVEAFSITDMATALEQQAPLMWCLLGSLLESDPSRGCRRARYHEASGRAPSREDLGSTESNWDEEDEYWERVGEDLTEGVLEELAGASGSKLSKRQRRAGERNCALDPIVSYIPVCPQLYAHSLNL